MDPPGWRVKGGIKGGEEATVCSERGFSQRGRFILGSSAIILMTNSAKVKTLEAQIRMQGLWH